MVLFQVLFGRPEFFSSLLGVGFIVRLVVLVPARPVLVCFGGEKLGGGNWLDVPIDESQVQRPPGVPKAVGPIYANPANINVSGPQTKFPAPSKKKQAHPPSLLWISAVVRPIETGQERCISQRHHLAGGGNFRASNKILL